MKVNEQQYARIMNIQEQSTQTGTVLYEKGLELVSVSGIIWSADNQVTVFGDPSSPAFTQKRTVIPTHRIVQVDMDGEELELQ